MLSTVVGHGPGYSVYLIREGPKHHGPGIGLRDSLMSSQGTFTIQGKRFNSEKAKTFSPYFF